MKAFISKSTVRGRAEAPSSKSYTLRGLVCAALADGQSEIDRPLYADDTAAGRDVLQKIGVGIIEKGRAWLVSGGHFRQPDSELYCRDSAGTLRFLTAVCALVPGTSRLTAGPTLSRRPILPLINALRSLGVNCYAKGDMAPVTVEGGRLKGGETNLPGDISSQMVSAMLFIAPLSEKGIALHLTPPVESKPYIGMTIDCMKQFGVEVEHSPDFISYQVRPQAYRPTKFRAEGDWSSASYLLALGAVDGEVDVSNLSRSSRQADRQIWILLNMMGAAILAGHNSVKTSMSALKAVKADLSDCIDLLPTMAVLAASASGVTELTGISRARLKESDRVGAVKEGLERMGIAVREEKDTMFITGGAPQGAVINSRGDHRIAMAFSILGVLAGGTVIEDAGCVNKTYPEFWDVLKSLGGGVVLDGQ
jgi:3-phosphoshikimate 1-carboxyvinyltransferase